MRLLAKKINGAAYLPISCSVPGCVAPEYRRDLCIYHNSLAKAEKEKLSQAPIRFGCDSPHNRVYAVRGGDLTKFGFSRNVDARLPALQIGSPIKLYLIGHIQGDVALERKIHRALADYHSHGEWFMRGPDVLDLERVFAKGKKDGVLKLINKFLPAY